jgi:3-carboxy-cis,cis-muconate cycloisomerase
MTISPIDSRIFSPLFSDPELAAEFADETFVQRLLEVEAALAAAQAGLGLIPAEAAQQIASEAARLDLDYDALRAGTEKAGVPVIELVRQLRARVGPESAGYVHWGATTQDVFDTAVVLQCRRSLDIVKSRLQVLIQALARLADGHRQTLMAGRTHSQQALPVTFGFKVAGWLAPLLRHRRRLEELLPRLLVVQYGGAAGTLAAVGKPGLAVQKALAAELALGVPLMPWHTQRDNIAELAAWLSMISSSLAKMAQDVILLAQSEVGEVRETADLSRGGSSTMPQKSNPVISEVIIAAARTNAGLLSAVHQSGIQEHERGTHGWQMEWLTLPQMLALTCSALNKAILLGENLVVDAPRMRANLDASNGLLLGEAIVYALSPKHMSRAEAAALVKEASRIAVEQDRHLFDVVREINAAPIDWPALRDESAYIGLSNDFVDRVLAEAGYEAAAE